jgi:hypothetical protein
MKILQFIGYIHLPDDFEGDEVDALQWYVDYRRKKDRVSTEYPELDYSLSVSEFLKEIWDLMHKNKKTRGGVFDILDDSTGEWKNISAWESK